MREMGNPDRMKIIGNNIKKARQSLNYTQGYIADKLDIGRPRYSEIENGKRNISLADLYRFADLFARPLEFFLNKDATNNSFKVLFRKAEGDTGLSDIIIQFEGLCEKMLELEKINEREVTPSAFDDYKYDTGKLKFWAKHYADYERSRLALGTMPLKNLDSILEEKCGLKIFYKPFSDIRKIFGLFANDTRMGGCILINSSPCAGNQLFSLAHEYAHYLFHKRKVGIISFIKDKDTLDERLANYFASEFLMPADEIISTFTKTVKSNKNITPEDVIYFADYYGVSFQSMAYRLNNLSLIKNKQKETLLEETYVNALRVSTGREEPSREKRKFPAYYTRLCINAYIKNKITPAVLANFLEIPLYEAMEMGKELEEAKKYGREKAL